RLSNRRHNAFEIIVRMLSRQLRTIGINNHTGVTVLIIPDMRTDLASISHVDDQGADGVSAEVQADGISACHKITPPFATLRMPNIEQFELCQQHCSVATSGLKIRLPGATLRLATTEGPAPSGRGFQNNEK